MTTSIPRLKWRTLKLEKHGNRPDEWEDALDGDETAGRFAVADGATETIFADVWATMLVRRFLADPIPDPLPDAAEWLNWLKPLRREWWDLVSPKSLPWAAEHKLDSGAAAALICLSIQPNSSWRAVAVGDCCLFHLREGALRRAFPVSNSRDFGNCPALISSRTSRPEPDLLEFTGDCRPGDQFLLMTDAIAQWFLAEDEAHHKPAATVDRLLNLPDNRALAVEIDKLRNARILNNDDVTVALIEVVAGPA